MLAPDDRQVLRELLRPEPGAELDVAVATTFTLDLTAALVAPLAFAAYDVSGTSDPIAVLEAVRAAAGRIDIFGQVGHIRVPKAASDLMAFLEPMLHEVTAPLPGFLFHPKVWVVRYRTPDGAAVRLLCGTRNLTDDVSWDAVVRLDGHLRGGPKAANRPLVDLVRALPDLTVRPLDPARRLRIEALVDDLRRVEWEAPADVRDVAFHVLGLRRSRGPTSLARALSGRRHLVMSPFLDDHGVALTTGGQPATVVATPEALERLTPVTLAGLDTRVVSPLAGLHQPDEDDDSAEGGGRSRSGAPTLLGGLHAKVYVIESGNRARMLVGSANATRAGLGNGNVEFVVELLSGPKSLGIDGFIGPDAPFARILEPYKPAGGAPESAEDTIGREAERLLRHVAGAALVADVSRGDAGWTERVHGDLQLELPAGAELQVGLLTREGSAVRQGDGRIEASFLGLVTADVTPFVVLRARRDDAGVTIERATVVRAELRGDPPGRLDEVLARQVDTPEKFLQFLALLFGLTQTLDAARAEGAGASGSWLFGRGGGAGLFELLVRAVADRPAAIDDLDRLVERLEATERGQQVLPEGFSALWTTIRRAHEQVRSHR